VTQRYLEDLAMRQIFGSERHLVEERTMTSGNDS